MEFLTTKFNRYNLYYFANDKEKKSSDCIAKINCYIDKGQEPKKHMGEVWSPIFMMKFFKDDSEIPPNELRLYAENTVMERQLKIKYGPVWKINLHYPISQFNDIISILRHQKKIFYLFIGGDIDNLKGGLLTEVPIDGNKYKDIEHYYD